MIYLITQLAGWLLLAAAFAAMSGWVYAAVRARPGEQAQLREREKLVRDLGALATGDAVGATDNGEMESLRSRVNVEAARAAEAERALEAARSRAEEATGQLAVLQRAIAKRGHDDAEHEAPQRALDVEATPVIGETPALQAWRLRYFEQRVRYLEGAGRESAPVSDAATPDPPPLEHFPATSMPSLGLGNAQIQTSRPLPGRKTAHTFPGSGLEWRARVAEARAAHLERELRDLERSQQPLAALVEPPQSLEIAAFAGDVKTDALLRWRMLYLERRVARLQEEAAPASAQASGSDSDSWKWRARYLEARLRHLQPPAGPTQPVAALAEAPVEPAPPPLVPAGSEQRPAVLPAARGGAPDDLTLIEGVTPLRQTTLYSLGVFHFDQIAEWSPAHVAWVDLYFRLRGRIVEEEWVEQAAELAREGPAAASKANPPSL